MCLWFNVLLKTNLFKIYDNRFLSYFITIIRRSFKIIVFALCINYKEKIKKTYILLKYIKYWTRIIK